jgi:hypothetical protein
MTWCRVRIPPPPPHWASGPWNCSASAALIARWRSKKARSSSRLRRSQPGPQRCTAGVARPADGHDVAQRVPPAARERQHAVPLQRGVGGTAVGAPTPRRLERAPLRVAEVVIDAIHPALAPASGSPCACQPPAGRRPAARRQAGTGCGAAPSASVGQRPPPSASSRPGASAMSASRSLPIHASGSPCALAG